MAHTILILEDHGAMRDALVHHIESSAVDATVMSFGSIDEIPESASPDLALVDLDLGADVDSDDVVQRLIGSCPTVIIMSASGPAAAVQGAIRAGAWTYVTKTANLAELDAALTAWTRGMGYLSGDLAGKLVTPQIADVDLDDRQRRALALFSTGMSHRALAQTMGITTTDVSDLLASSLAAYRR